MSSTNFLCRKIKNKLWIVLPVMLLPSCGMMDGRGTIAELRNVQLELKEERIEGSLDKAMESYRKFLEQTPESALTPEAIRRLADLKVEKEYGVVTESNKSAINSLDSGVETGEAAVDLAGTVEKSVVPVISGSVPLAVTDTDKKAQHVQTREESIASISETEKDFEKRAADNKALKSGSYKQPVVLPNGESVDLQTAGAMEAIQLYKNLLIKYPLYERNDQVLYQLSRAYEETGQVEPAMTVLNRLVKEYPHSRQIDEAQFRRGEYYFTRKRYLDAEEAYQAVLGFGVSSAFYEFALYKQGWSYFKQDLYEEALNDFIALLDYKITSGFDFDNVENQIEKKRIDDAYRVISLSFSYLGGPNAVVEYFDKYGGREYEASIYSHLGEYYLTKRRYADAALSYNTYVERNPLNKVSPYFNVRVIEIYLQGGFPKLVIESKKDFANTYGLRGAYWSFFDINGYPDILDYLKSNLVDLANHYHAQYQDKRQWKYKQDNFTESAHWYRQFLESFPENQQAPTINYQLADLMLENNNYRDAALEYERTSYNYPPHEKSAAAGYAAVYAYREYLKKADQAERAIVKREVIRSSLKFADAYPAHEQAANVLVAATNDLYEMKDYSQAVKTGRKLLVTYPQADKKTRHTTWLVIAHSTFELTSYREAEEAYLQVFELTAKNDPLLVELTENMAASIYKQGEQASLLEDHRTAANHYLRLSKVTPTAKIRPLAEYDAAASLIKLKDWAMASDVLVDFRARYPKHKLQADVTRKLAVVYKEDSKYILAAAEFERIEKQSTDNNIRREALLEAADLYEKAKDQEKALSIYNRFVDYFPEPVEFALETRNKIANIYKLNNDNDGYIKQLKVIVKEDANAGKQRTDRTRYLAATASLVLTEPVFNEFDAVKLVKPFKDNLKKKQKRMKQAIKAYTKLIDYEVADVTAASTYYIAEIYFSFNRALVTSERPKKLNDDELEQYELMIEEQAFPFEEKTIKVHEKNIELLASGVYNVWIDKSISKLAVLLPARYLKPEENSPFVESLLASSSNDWIKNQSPEHAMINQGVSNE